MPVLHARAVERVDEGEALEPSVRRPQEKQAGEQRRGTVRSDARRGQRQARAPR
ncbi:hypothetical protein [Streptomyces sp. NPDC094466]|uniref:hypothetical protein n=1 Tax=Streptomyces sp. NPDC094466 TaxID=3366065 RepID=UPI00382DF64C